MGHCKHRPASFSHLQLWHANGTDCPPPAGNQLGQSIVLKNFKNRRIMKGSVSRGKKSIIGSFSHFFFQKLTSQIGAWLYGVNQSYFCYHWKLEYIKKNVKQASILTYRIFLVVMLIYAHVACFAVSNFFRIKVRERESVLSVHVDLILNLRSYIF